MRHKQTASLSAGLVAVKGTALPAPTTPDAPADATGMPLNFRVPEQFRREFKVYAAQHGLKLNELLRRSFEAYRSSHGPGSGSGSGGK
jgi:hypothetical protein